MKKSLLQKMKKEIKTEYPAVISDLYLFGSRAYGNPTDYSDYDFLVVLKDDIDWQLKKSINKIFYKYALDYDFIPDIKYVTNKNINEGKNLEYFVFEALEKGIRITT